MLGGRHLGGPDQRGLGSRSIDQLELGLTDTKAIAVGEPMSAHALATDEHARMTVLVDEAPTTLLRNQPGMDA